MTRPSFPVPRRPLNNFLLKSPPIEYYVPSELFLIVLWLDPCTSEVCRVGERIG